MENVLFLYKARTLQPQNTETESTENKLKSPNI